MIKQNLHTHTVYCDGKNTVEDMVETAIEKGFNVLGFSGHGYNLPLDDISMSDEKQASYILDVQKAKCKYKDTIQVYLGIEQDSIGRRFSHKDFDYIIGSVHYVKYKDTYMAVDYSKEVTDQILRDEYHNDFLEYACAYYQEVMKLADYEEVDIIGHLDLLMKYNEEQGYISFTNPEYVKMAYACIDRCIEKKKIFEVNTGAIARGYRTNPYPAKNLLRYIFEKGGKICLNSDCHNKEFLDCFFQESIEIIKECGFTSMMVLTPKGFKEMAI